MALYSLIDSLKSGTLPSKQELSRLITRLSAPDAPQEEKAYLFSAAREVCERFY